MANAIHAHSDPKDQTDQLAPQVQLDQKEPQAKVACPVQMANLVDQVTLPPDPMANLAAQEPKVTVVQMEPKDVKAQQEAKAQPAVQAQQDQRVQQVPKVKTVDQAQQVDQDQMLKTATSAAEDHKALQANQVHQAKTPPIAHVQDALKHLPHHKLSIMKPAFFAIFMFAKLDYKM